MTRRGPTPTALVTLLLGILLAVASTGGAGAQQADPTGTEPTEAPPATPGMTLVEQTTWVAEGGEFTVRVDPGPAPDDATLTVSVHDAVGSRSAFAASLTGQALGAPLVSVDDVPLGLLARAGDGSVAVTLPADQVAELNGSGVYPVDVTLAGPDGAPAQRLITHLVRVPGQTESPPLSVAVIVPVDGSPALAPDGTVAFTDEGVEGVATVAAALTSHPAVPLTVDVTPETIDALALADDTDRGPLLDRLARAVRGRQVLGGSYADLDVASWVATSLGGDPLAAQLTAGAAAVDEHLGVRADRRTWVFNEPTTPEALTRLRELGVDQVVLPEDALSPLDPAVFPVSLTQTFEVPTAGGDLQRAAAADRALSAHLGSTGDPVLDAQRTLTDLAVLYFDRPALIRGVALPLPSGQQVPAEFLTTLLDGLGDQQQVLGPVTVDRLFASVQDTGAGGEADTSGTPLVRTLTPATTTDLQSYADDVGLTTLVLTGYGQLVSTDLPQYRTLQRLTLASGDRSLDHAGRTEYIATISDTIDSTVAGIVAPEDQTITLTARDGTIPLRLTNDNAFPVDVLVELESDQLDFPDGNQVPATLAPGETTIDVRVETRASGAFPLEARVVSPDEILDLTSTEYRVRSTALSGVGIVLSGGALLILLVWWLRHFRKLRRNRALVAETHPSVSAAADDADPDPAGDPAEEAGDPADQPSRPTPAAPPGRDPS